MEKAAGITDGFKLFAHRRTGTNIPGSALTRFEATVGLVDHIDATATTNHAVVTVASFKGLQRIDDFHRIVP
jgi:hypothetical protein